jgi:lipooligosaccharide transport system permease protein
VSTINHFNFFFTGFLSPMFFFSGVVFPIDNLPTVLRPVAEIFPLTHSVRMARALDLGVVSGELGIDLICILGFTGIAGYFAIRRLKRKLIQ